jgi:hypothetical protein
LGCFLEDNAFPVIAQKPIAEISNRAQRRLGCLAVRRMARIGEKHCVNRAVTLVLRKLDLPHSAVLIVLAL